MPELLRTAAAAATEASRAKIERMRLSPHCDKLADYLKLSMGGLAFETLRILFLDPSHRLIADEQMQTGTIDRLTLYPRTIFRRAMELEAAALILVHNHPSGDAEPSACDIAVTNQLFATGRLLDIDILGHIIVTVRGHRLIFPDGRDKRSSCGSFDLRSGGRRAGNASGPSGSVASALVNARRTMRRRILRNQLLDAPDLFGEPAWDIILELFVHEAEGRPIATSSLCIASGLSMTSALRLLQRMEEGGLIEREADPDDGRRNFIRLTPPVAHRLTAYFKEGGE